MSDNPISLNPDRAGADKPLTRYNPPGSDALVYRGAPYATALSRMLARLPQERGGDEDGDRNGGGSTPLARLNVDEQSDWTIALLHAWAAVTDVLTFYQERINNEGYLRTAQEDRSVLELARAIGYAIRPGLAADAHLAFDVAKQSDRPHQLAELPAGLAVQSVAVPGSQSQIFETIAPFTARSEWNALGPVPYHDVRWRQDIREDSTHLRLQGVQTGISVGDTVMVISQPWLYRLTEVEKADGKNSLCLHWENEYLTPDKQVLNQVDLNDQAPAKGDWILFLVNPVTTVPDTPTLIVKLHSVNPLPDKGMTVISWRHPIDGIVMQELSGSRLGLAVGERVLLVGERHGHLPKDEPRLIGTVAAVQTEPALGRTTLHLEQDPRVTRSARAIRNPRFFALRQQAALFTYTSSGLFANSGPKGEWRPQGMGLPPVTIREVLRHPQKLIFAATAKGVFRSEDDGATWTALTVGVHDQDVYSLVLTEEDQIMAGTVDGGIYLSKDRGDNWVALSGEAVQPYARNLRKWFPKWFALTTLPKTVVRDLITYRSGGRHTIAAATDVGIFRSTNHGRSWRPVNRDLPALDPKTGFSETVAYSMAVIKNKHLFAATSAGVYHIRNRRRPDVRAVLANVLKTVIVLAGMLAGLVLLEQLFMEGNGWVTGGLYWIAGQGLSATPMGATVVILAMLALLCALVTRYTWVRYMNHNEETGVEAYALLTGKAGTGETLYAGTRKGVLQSTPPAKWFGRTLARGRPVVSWRSISQPGPLFTLDSISDEPSAPPNLDKDLRAAFDRQGLSLPDDAVVEGNAPFFSIVSTDGKRKRLATVQRDREFLHGYPAETSRPILLDAKSYETDLDRSSLSDTLRPLLEAWLGPLPKQNVVTVRERKNRWHIHGRDGQVLAGIERLVEDDGRLIVYQGMLRKQKLLPPTALSALETATRTPAFNAAWDKLQLELPAEARLFVSTPGLHWQLLNSYDVPLYEIWHTHDIRQADDAPDDQLDNRLDSALIVLEAQPIQALYTNKDEADNLLAGGSGEVYSKGAGGLWTRQDVGLALIDIKSITMLEKKLFAAGTPPEGSTESGWSPHHIRKNFVDLDGIYPSLQPDSWLILRKTAQDIQERRSAAQDEPIVDVIYQVRRVTVEDSVDFMKPRRFTRIQVDSDKHLDDFDRNSASVWGESTPLPLFDDRPVYGRKIVLDIPVPGLEPGKKLIVRGKPMRARIAKTCKNKCLIMQAKHDQRTTKLQPGEALQILAVEEAKIGEAKVEEAKEGSRCWTLRNADRFEGCVEADFKQIILEPALDDDADVNEVVELESIDIVADSSQTSLTLCAPLTTIYDRSTLRVLANVVPATHGQTIRGEVLGSSQGRAAYERFELRQRPLTFLPAADSAAVESTLKVFVNDVEWPNRPFFDEAMTPNDRAYVVHSNEEGGSTIIFGNGIHGARLPANTEQVKVNYRIGAGPEGNVAADSLTALQTRVANLQGVTNPLPATGGVGRESRQQTRRTAPLLARTSDRIVALNDFEHFTAAFPGIGKAKATLLTAGGRQLIHITIADREGVALVEGSRIYEGLRNAIDAQRARPEPVVVLQSFHPVYFCINATLSIQSDHWERRPAIEAAAREQLTTVFAFDSREFAQAVTKSEIIAALHDADDAIVDVYVKELKRVKEPQSEEEPQCEEDDEGRTDADRLEAKPALYTHEGWHPAELLLINDNPEHGIQLFLEKAV